VGNTIRSSWFEIVGSIIARDAAPLLPMERPVARVLEDKLVGVVRRDDRGEVVVGGLVVEGHINDHVRATVGRWLGLGRFVEQNYRALSLNSSIDTYKSLFIKCQCSARILIYPWYPGISSSTHLPFDI
jgi:hypothetical protein